MSRASTYVLLTTVMFIWGLNVVAVKYLVVYFPPVSMQGFRILIAAITAILILCFLRDLRMLTKQEWKYTVLAAFFGQLGHHSLLAVGLVSTTASNASLILALIPLTTSILALLVFRDTLTKLRIIGIGLGFTGVAIVVLQGNGVGVISHGDLFVFISMFSQSISFILIKKCTATLSSRQMTAVMLGIGSLLLIGTSFFIEPQGVQIWSQGTVLIWTIFFLSAIVATGLGHFIYNGAIQKLGAGQTAIFNNLVPFFTLIGAYLFLGESIRISQIVGFFLIVSGVLLGTGYVDNLVKKRRLSKSKQRYSA